MKQYLDKATRARTEAMESQHRRVQSQIEMLPAETRNNVKAIQKLVDHEIAENNALFFNDGMFAADAFLKRHGLPGSCKEDFKIVISAAKPGQVFLFGNRPFIKSYDGLIHGVSDYIRSLEMTIAEQVEFKEVKYVSYLTNVDRFLISIKLFFKRLF